MRIKDQVAVITGGASGMGEAISYLFGREGGQIIVCDINDDNARRVARKITDEGGRAANLHLDVTHEDEVRKVFAQVAVEYGRIDILVNCVGLAHFGPTVELTLEQWVKIINVNLTGPFLCCREAGKVMIEQRSGKIVNFGSTGGLSGVPYMAHYTAAKHGVVGLTKALAVEWGKYNVHVNCICPGATQTAMLMSTTDEAYRKERSRRVPLQRLGLPEEQASVALFLSSSESDYINGAYICVDGGAYAMSPVTSTEIIEGK
jgi:NAD(P)-dependent dehydrogenase (short-subunit alcohol dehydrogenase family)